MLAYILWAILPRRASRGDMSRTCHRVEGLLILVDLGWINVDVHDLRRGCERLELAGHPVVEADAKSEQEVSLVDSKVRSHRPVHPKHLHDWG